MQVGTSAFISGATNADDELGYLTQRASAGDTVLSGSYQLGN
jgi:hypothetical protein